MKRKQVQRWLVSEGFQLIRSIKHEVWGKNGVQVTISRSSSEASPLVIKSIKKAIKQAALNAATQIVETQSVMLEEAA